MQQTMYPGLANSPQTELAAGIDAAQNTISLVDATKVPAAPNLVTIGSDETAETVLYTGISGNDLAGVTRGFEGAAKAWSAGSKVARNFTARDLNDAQQNITDHENRVSSAETRITASLYPLEREVAQLKAVSSLKDRVDGASDYFYDLMDGLNGGSAGKIDKTSTNVVGATSVGTSVVTVQSVTGISAGQELTIFDDVNLERPIVQAVDGAAKTVTFTAALTKAYKDQAQLCRSSVVQDTTNKLLTFGGWSKIGTVTVSSPETVISPAYDTTGSGRKLVRLNSGNVYAAIRAGNDFRIYKRVPGGTWTLLVSLTDNIVDVSLATNGTQLYVINGFGQTGLNFRRYDESGVLQGTVINVDTGQTLMSNCNLIVNNAGTELHAAWMSKNATYPNSTNIRYAKGTISGDGTVTWGAVTQITTNNTTGTDVNNPSIVVKSNNNPVIIAQSTPTTSYAILAWIWNGSAWTTSTGVTIYAGLSNVQIDASAVISPDGTIHVAWSGVDATDTTKYNIRYSKSTDGGTTWSPMVKLTSGNSYHQFEPSITADKNNNLYIVFSGIDSAVNATYRNIRKIDWNGTAWSSVVTLTNNTTGDTTAPKTMVNYTDFTEALVIYRDNQGTGVKFRGTWQTGVIVPILVEDVRYNITPPSNVSSAVAWVDRQTDAGLSLDAALSIHSATENFTAMTKATATVDGSTSEDQLTGTGTSNSKATLRLTMTRTNTSIAKSIIQITGAVGA